MQLSLLGAPVSEQQLRTSIMKSAKTQRDAIQDYMQPGFESQLPVFSMMKIFNSGNETFQKFSELEVAKLLTNLQLGLKLTEREM